MADEVDMANDLINSAISRALNNRRQYEAANAKGAKFCTECGDDIPVARQNLGFKLCVSCAEERERRGQLFANE